ncbi:MAG: FAD-dependent monooxygenase [Desulfocapsaceae bacterium]|nr:FAD-dependent monooxygenase [Desulfocapsaceae bacterium]
MGYKEITVKLPPDYSQELLQAQVAKAEGLRDFSVQIVHKSLDARKKANIHWLVQLALVSPEIPGEAPPAPPLLHIPFRKRKEQALVVGSGPAGFFAAFVLQKAGFETTLIERGAEVRQREEGIRVFEESGVFDAKGNYAFGEGGAGTFSDGKLTSRTKNISLEKAFVLESYIQAGAPPEIRYLAHPHLGSDNLKNIVRRLREEFIRIGGSMRFETLLTDLEVQNGRVVSALTDQGAIEADYYVIAPGHSAHETYRMLIGKGVGFRPKNFAIGCRVEHPQALINRAQWGREELPGVKAAEYRLTSKGDGKLPVYTFCMCPGGVVVPSTAYADTNIVNGMSLYKRDGQFANAACVAGVNLPQLLGRELSALEALDWLGTLEQDFFHHGKGYQAPYCRIDDFIHVKEPRGEVQSSYPLGLTPAPLWNLLPPEISASIREGLKEFSRKIKGFETGIIMGLESKTSSPIQVLREAEGLCCGFENLYLVGEGSGYAGGIISSGTNGIKAALHIAQAA